MALAEKLAAEGFRVVSGGTETHLFLLDLRPVGISGHQAQDVLDSVDINTNMNEIPYDPTPPTVTSGIRLGTPAVTTRGMQPGDMDHLGDVISRALKSRGDESLLAGIRGEVAEMAARFSIYQ